MVILVCFGADVIVHAILYGYVWKLEYAHFICCLYCLIDLEILVFDFISGFSACFIMIPS